MSSKKIKQQILEFRGYDSKNSKEKLFNIKGKKYFMSSIQNFDVVSIYVLIKILDKIINYIR